MKSKWILLLLFSLAAIHGAAQASQRKVLIQQIAALRIYGEYLEKGYTIGRDGLKMVGDLKDGELNLHSDYFNSLGQVNATIANINMVAQIIELQQNILAVTNGMVYDSAQLSGTENAYCERVRRRLLKECSDELQKLYAILTEKALVMEDAHRLQIIKSIHAAMQDNYTFIKGFSNEIRLLIREKARSQREVNTSRQFNAIN